VKGRARSLRRRLVLGLLAVVALGLVAFAATTYGAVRAFVLHRTDTDALATERAAAVSVRSALRSAHGDSNLPSAVRAIQRALGDALPPGDAAQVRLVGAPAIGVAAGPPHQPPVLAFAPVITMLASIPAPDVDGSGADYYTASSGHVQYRIASSRLPGSRAVLLVAIPMTDATSTLQRLLTVEVIGGVALLALLGFLALVVVRRGLRPLDAIADTAAAITAGARGSRIAGAEDETEIGRVTAALNRMLAENEAALVAKEASESRLRRFVADASHELRTPLTSIRSYADLLETAAAHTPAERRVALERIQGESVRMTRLVEDLLLLARLDMGRPLQKARVDVALLAEHAVADARTVAPGRAIGLSAPGPVHVRGDNDRLHQVIANLLANAVVHTPSVAPIDVAVHEDGPVVVISVRDHGSGIEPVHGAHVFDPFYRVHPARPRQAGGITGVGLGLAIVAAIVRAHGGDVQLAAPPGGGAEFIVRLPAENPSPGRRRDAREPSAAQRVGAG